MWPVLNPPSVVTIGRPVLRGFSSVVAGDESSLYGDDRQTHFTGLFKQPASTFEMAAWDPYLV